MRKEVIRPWMIGVAALMLLAGVGAAVPSIRASFIDTNVVGTLTVNGAIIPNVAGTQSVGTRAVPYSEFDSNFVYLQAGGGVQSNPTSPGTLHLGDVSSTSIVSNQPGNVFTMNGILQAGSGTGNLDWSPSSGKFLLPTGGMPAGTGTATGQPVISLYRDASVTNSVTTGETFGTAYTMPANTLSANGQALHITAAWVHAANGNLTTAKLYVNGTAILSQNNSTSGDVILTDFEIVRTSATTATYQGRSLNLNGAYVGSRGMNYAIVATSAMTIQLSVTGAVTNGDLSTNYLRVEWKP